MVLLAEVDPLEEDLAILVETVLKGEGRPIGVRQPRDGLDGSGVLVDFTYDEAVPPIALEITGLHDDAFLQAASAGRKLAERLNRLAQQEGLPPFRITVHERARMRDLDVPLSEVMRSGQGITVGSYTSDDLMSWQRRGTLEKRLRQHRELEALGVARAVPAPADAAVTVSTWGESPRWAPLANIDTLVGANLAKLVATGAQYERHLAIGIGRYGISQRVEDTPVFALPDALDRLWLVHLWTGVNGPREVWSLSRGEAAWRMHTPVRPVR